MKKAKGKAFKTNPNLLIAILGDEASVSGFLLTGMGERNKLGQNNFLIVDKGKIKERVMGRDQQEGN